MLGLFKSTVLFLLVFGVLYYETQLVAGVKVSHAWKFVVEIALLCGILMLRIADSRGLRSGERSLMPASLGFGYLFALWPLVGALGFYSPKDGVFYAAARVFPWLVLHFLWAAGCGLPGVIKLQRAAVLFVALAALPFVFGWLEPLGNAYDLSALDIPRGAAFVGVFQNPHAASVALSMSALVASLFALREVQRGRRFYWTLLAAFLVGLTLFTFARTGVVAYLAGVLIYTLLVRNRRVWRSVVVGLVLLSLLLGYQAATNEAVRMRLAGTNIVVDNTSVYSLGSGRVRLWTESMKIYLEQDPVHWLSGIGHSGVKAEMLLTPIRKDVFAHNAFVHELVAHGLIGLLLLCAFLAVLFRDMWRVQEIEIRARGLAVLSAFVVFGFFQTFDYPLQLILLMLFALECHLQSDTVAQGRAGSRFAAAVPEPQTLRDHVLGNG